MTQFCSWICAIIFTQTYSIVLLKFFFIGCILIVFSRYLISRHFYFKLEKNVSLAAKLGIKWNQDSNINISISQSTNAFCNIFHVSKNNGVLANLFVCSVDCPTFCSGKISVRNKHQLWSLCRTTMGIIQIRKQKTLRRFERRGKITKISRDLLKMTYFIFQPQKPLTF